MAIEMTDILNLLRDASLEQLMQSAQESVRKNKKSRVHLRGLMEFSNICKRNCVYCGLRSANSKVRRYCMSQDDIIAAAAKADKAGVDTFVLQSGEGAVDAQWLAEIVQELRIKFAKPVTLSVGECSDADYKLWRDAGAERYLLKHETANPDLYARLHPGYALKDRIRCLKILKDLGYETGSGFILGLPGQTLEIIAADIALCHNLNIDMCGVGPFIPQTGTPLCDMPSPDINLVLKVLAILRILIPRANLPATTALATLDTQKGQVKGMLAGANVLMPNFTPPEYAANYTIYDHKNRVALAEALRNIKEAGRDYRLV